MIDYKEAIRRLEAVSNGYWIIPENLDTSEFNFNWRPNPTDRPYIHQFGTQWQRTGGPRFVVPGHEGVKYHDSQKALRLPDKSKFKILVNTDIDFDFSWHPDENEPDFIWTFGNQYLSAEEMPTVEYIVNDAKQRKYVDNINANLVSNIDHWAINNIIDLSEFDLSWYPHPYEPPYIYVWGNQYLSAEEMPTVEYHMPGATNRKYMNDRKAKLISSKNNWVINDKNIFPMQIDMKWAPHPHDPPYIYAWGNKWVPAEVRPTIEFHVPGATEFKYMGNNVELLPEEDRWKILKEIDSNSFDFSWRPNPYEPPYIYVWGNQYLSAEEMPTVEYHMPGATNRKYMNDRIAKLSNNMDCWVINDDIVKLGFDFSWTPHPHDPPYIYAWGNKWVSAEVKSTLEYRVPGATEYKYMPELVEVVPEWSKWSIHDKVKDFDFSWRPNPYDTPYIYVWGNKWIPGESSATLEYYCEGATQIKYMDELVELEVQYNMWNIMLDVDESSFDFTWRPDPNSPPYIYVWGNQWNPAEVEPTIEYHVSGATDRKYMQERVKILENNMSSTFVTSVQNKKNFKVLVEGAEMDFSWRPNPTDPPYIYVWGNKWNPAEVEPTIEYHVPGATDRKYMHDRVAILKPTKYNWSVNKVEDLETFDFSWRPNPHSPPQIYQWEDNGPTYTVSGGTAVVFMKRTDSFNAILIPKYVIKTTLEDLISQHENEVFWALNPDLSYDKFDFYWKPDETNFMHINVFGNEFSKDTQTYYVNGPMYKLGYKQLNYIETQTVSVDSNLSMFYVDTGNSDCVERFDALKARYPQIQKTRFLNSWVDTISRCIKKSETKLLWVLSSDYDYADFEFDFYPGTWQMEMTHVFGSQYSHWGNTYLVNKESFIKDTKYVKIIEHLKNINHVRSKKAKTHACKHDILYINFGNVDDGNNLIKLKNTGRTVYETTYDTSYISTIKNFIEANPKLVSKQNYFIWVTNSICDYSKFDFSFQHDPYQSEQLHVFSSELSKSRTKFGDTFLININEFNNNSANLTDLEKYTNKVNYIEHISVTRKPHPVIKHCYDSQAEAIKNLNVDYFPYYELVNEDSIGIKTNIISMWDSKKSTVLIGSKGASQITVPHMAVNTIKEEVYDYPYIDTAKHLSDSKPLDIVFISNGEPIADENYERLLSVLKKLNVPNKVQRVSNVNGRVASQHSAANISNTNWYFLVNGKVRVNETFDWSWQPDRLQQPKHYIFTVTNPVNSLIYGHQAIVANNKNLTLSTVTKGLDFTLDSLHEVVDMNCGIAIYNTDPWTTWRTAFRESIKLCNNNDAISKFRLERWTSYGTGDYCEISQQGALDGIQYFESVNGELAKLMLSYDWDWIQKYYSSKYK